MKKTFLALIFLAICNIAVAQVITPFTVRKTITQKGGIVYLSNTASKAVPDNIVQNEIPPSGTGYDNNYTNGYVDIDSDASTWMSSSDQLNLPNCSKISWAGLYWGADCSSGDENFATRNQVKLKVNAGSYINLTADYLKDNASGFRTYHCFKDITSILQANGLTDRYTIANVATDIGGKNLFGGWTIVVIYQNNIQTMRNLTVFDGLANVMAGTYSTVDIPISGFQTPLAGPVTFELGLVVYDGDRSLTGDQLLFKGASSFINISDAIHPVSDMFNSTLSSNGALTSLRNPSYNNTLGYDANIFVPNNTAKNYIGNNAISATIRQTTGGETYLTQVVTSAIDVYEPDLRSAVRVKNITHPGTINAQPGDILEYTVNGLNIGSDPSVNTFITDTIEGNAQFIPGSIKITYGPNSGVMSDAVGDDQAEYISSSKVVKVRIGVGANSFNGGLVNNSPSGIDSTQFTYRVQATTDCVYLACDNVINNSAHIVGTGNISGNTFDNASNPGVFDAFGCPVTGSTQTPIITSGCSAPTASANSPICQGGNINFTASYSPSATYLWTGPNGFTSTLREPTITNVSALNAGIYTSNIYITGTGCHFVHQFTADINIANAGPDQIGTSTCGLTTLTLAGNSPTGSTGTWSIVSGTGGSFGDGYTATSNVPASTFNGVSGNTYTLRWSLSNPGCSDTHDDVNITFNSAASNATLSGTSVTCANHLNVAITGGVSPYTVIIDNGVGSIYNYTSGSDIPVSPASTSQYNLLSVTGANGCVASSISGNPTTITINNSMGTGTITATTGAPTGIPYITSETYPTIASAGASSPTWANPTNALTNNSSYSVLTLSSTTNGSQYLYLTGFFGASTFPATATIDGIVVKVKKHATGTITDSRVQLYNGSGQGNAKTLSGSWPTTDNVYTYGTSTDLWGAALTYSTLNNTNFGIRIRVNSTNAATAYIDYATMTVYYHTGTTAYCDNVSNAGFTVSGFTNATSYTWVPPTGATIVSGQGTTSTVIDFNGAGQSGNYTVMVTPSNSCGTGTPATLNVPVSHCTSSMSYLMGNVYWDINGTTTPQKVDGTGIGKINGTQLYVTIGKNSGGTKNVIANSVAVNTDGSYKIACSLANGTTYKIVMGTNQYTTANTTASMVAALSPSNGSYLGEIYNNLANSTTGNDGTVDGIINYTPGSTPTSNLINFNFSVKIPTAPVAYNDAITTNEDTPVTINVTTNDKDVDGTINVATVVLGTGTNGTWNVNPSGVISYTPTANFNGTATITYTVKDNDGLTSNSATLTITVNPVNDPPVATASSFTTSENTAYTFSTADFNYTDVESNSMVSITIATLPALGELKLNGVAVTAGQTITLSDISNLTYTPEKDQDGSPYTTFTFKANDVDLGTIAGTMTINVTHVNVAPEAVNDVATTNQNNPIIITILSNDININGTILTNSVDLDPVTPLQQNSTTIPGQGTFTDDGAGNINFTPLAAYYGTTTPIYYTVKNSFGLVSNTASITVTVIPLGAPIAVNDVASTNENVSVTFNITNNDTDDGSINVSRVDLDPTTSGIQQSYYVLGEGQFSVDMLGNVTFTPDWNFYGTVTAHYTVKDNLNLISNIATITVTVNWVNANPFSVDDLVTTNEDTPITFSVTANDYDIDGTVNISTVDLDLKTAGKQTTYTVVGEGVYTADNAGNVTFTPVLNFNGTATPKGYTINDNLGAVSDSAIILVTVTPVNDAPVAVDDIANTVETSTTASVTFNITSNDTDIDGTIDASSVDLDPYTTGRQTTYTIVGEGTYTVDNSGNVTFSYSFATPVASCTPIHYTVNDNQGLVSNIGTITVTVLSAGTPLAVDDIIMTNEDTPISFDVTSNDTDNNGIDPSSVTLIGSLSTSSGTWSITDVANSPGYVTFSPASNFFGTASITYTVKDFDPLTSNIATITVTVNPVNDAPSFTKGGNQIVCENSGVQIVSNWATSMSVGPSNESSQTHSFIVTNDNNLLFTDQPSIDETGTLYYTPAVNHSGSAIVSVKIKDNGGTLNGGADESAIQTFTITVNSQSAPIVGVITQPTCGSPAGSVALSGLPAVGTWTLTPSVGLPVTGTGTTYTLNNLAASTIYTFTVTNSDGCSSGNSANATINAIPSAPSIPTVASTTQPTCGTPSGTIVFNAQAGVEYSVGSGYQVGATFSSLVPGIYTLTVRNIADNTCITPAASTVTINAIPSAPSIPTVASTTQPTCGTPLGTIVFNTQANVDYSIGSGYQVGETFSGLAPGIYTLTVRSITDNTCITPASSTVTINAIPSAPSIPTVASTTQPTCGTPSGTIVFNAQAGVEYSVGSGYQVGETFSGLAPGIYTLTVRSITDNTCITPAASTVTINAIPSAPSTPTVASTTQPTCGTPEGTIVFNAQAGVEYSVGSGYQVGETFSGLAPGIYTLTVRSITDNTCITPAVSTVTINAVPSPPSAPTAASAQNFCGGSNPEVSDITVTGSNITWYSAAIGGSIIPSSTLLVDGTTYYASQSVGDCESSSRTAVTVTLLACSGPRIVDYTLSLDENSPNGTFVYNVNDDNSGVDKDIDGNNLTYTIISGNSSGAFTINATTGVITVIDGSKLDYETISSFVLVVRASNGTITDDGTITINLNNLNDCNPVAVADNYTVVEGGTLNINSTLGILINDTDADGNSLTAIKVTDPSNGTLTVNSDGSFIYVHDGSETNSDSFTYKANDGLHNSNVVVVTITITPVNDPPVAVNDTYTINEDGTSTGNLLGNDSDPEVDPLTITTTPVVDVSHGTLVINADGTFTYTPDPNYSGTDTFTYQACDSHGACSQATVTITINPVNDPPAAVNDTYTINEDGTSTGNLLGNDSDPEGDPLTITTTPVVDVSHGTLVINADGTFTYTPDPNYSGTDTFTYQVCDSHGACSQATVTITINPVNDPPVAVNDTYTINEDGTSTGNLLSNDSDPEGDPLTITTTPVVDVSHGVLVINADGTFTYTPDPNYSGSDTFTYQVCDSHGACSQATVTITINPVNDPPLAVNDTYTINEDGTSTGNLLSNDSDPEGDPLTITTTPVVDVSHGTLVINADGTFMYTPDPNYSGTDTFTYQVCDSHGACSQAAVTITINPINDPPVAVNDTYTINEDGTSTGNLFGNDSDPEGDPLTITTTPVVDVSHGTLVINADGTFTYTPDPNYSGTDTFTYQVCDSHGACSQATVTITINPVNDPPVAVNDTYTINEDGTSTGNLLGNDSDPEGDPLTITTTPVVDVSHGALVINADGTFTYTPDPNYSGTDTFTYQVCDSHGVCSQATVTITINPVNDPPVAVNDTYTINEDGTSTGNLLGNDSDPESDPLTITTTPVVDVSHGVLVINADGTFTYTPDPNYSGSDTFTYQVCDSHGACSQATVIITINPVNDPPVANVDTYSIIKGGTLSVSTSNGVLKNDTDSDSDPLSAILVTSVSHGTLTLNTDGSFIYTNDGSGATNDSFTYKVNDGTADGNTVTVAITIYTINTPPVAVDDSYSVAKGGTILTTSTTGVLSNDTDAESNTLSAILVSTVSHGTLTLNSDGSFTYINDGSGATNDSFTYKVNDGIVDGNTATVSISITFINHLPIATADSYSVNEGETLTISSPGVLTNDTDADGNTLAAIVTINPSHGLLTLNADGSFTYTHDGSETTSDSFNYKVNDGIADGNTVVVTITIIPLNDVPVAIDDSNSINEGEINVAGNILNNDTDADGDILHVSTINGSSSTTLISGVYGSLTCDAQGNYSYALDNSNEAIKALNDGQTLVETFTYSVTDGNGGNSSASLVITINGKTNSEDVIVPQGFSPDGDGTGDTFTILGIENNPDNELIVYNRWGTEVYRKKHYNNEWDGRSSATNAKLPVGTYFYILTVKGKSSTYKGYVYIKY